MAKIVLAPVENSYDLTSLNNNFEKLAFELNERILYRNNINPNEPNSMTTNLDMNGKRLYNLPIPIYPGEAARLKDVQDAVSGLPTATLIPFTPYGTVTASNVQGAIQQVSDQSDYQTIDRAVENIAALRLVSSLKYSFIKVQGYYTKGDGGGGNYALDTLDVSSPDNGGSTIVATDGGRWKLAVTDFVSVKQFGAKGDSLADDTGPIERAIASLKPNQAVVLSGVHRCLRKLNILKETAIVGSDPRNANLPDFNNSASCLIFSNVADGGIVGNFNVSLSNVVVISYADFGVRLVDGSLMTNNVLIQGGNSASVSILRGYYNKFVNTRFEFSAGLGAIFSNCYNISSTNLSVRGAPSCLSLLDGSTMTMNGGSLEDNTPTGYGVTLRGGSSINFFGTYFEGSVIGGVGGRCVSMGPNCQVSAVGCHVYMSTLSHWITVEDSLSTGVRLFSRNNNLVWPTGSFATTAYDLLNTDATGSCDISGDNWPNQQGGVPGPNCKYVGDTFTSGTGPVQNVGSYVIVFPPGNGFFGKNINTRPICTNTSNSTPGTPQPGVIVNYGNNGVSGDDPLGLHLGGWGYNTYQAVYQKGQWEKVGLRLTPQSDISTANATDLPTAIALANATKTAFNTLLSNLRNAGVMV